MMMAVESWFANRITNAHGRKSLEGNSAEAQISYRTELGELGKV